MALIRCDFFSHTLRLQTSMTVVLPQDEAGGTDVPVLYLLHGLSEDDSAWSRCSSIERYATDRGIAVVMPAGHRSFYADQAHGLPFWTFLSQELPRAVHSMFKVSGQRERTFVAGTSMGGYGAMKWAMRDPQRFAAAASLSGVLGLRYPDPGMPDEIRETLDLVFDGREISGTDDDTMHLLATADATTLPRLLVACGQQEGLLQQSQDFAALAQQRGIDVTTDFPDGGHDWANWDLQIQRVLDWMLARG
ncbi:MAG: alpha/beta hydrolase family protein [Candidatus Nanopelagicales bacterium]|nr:alpha/beta hydrolase family protein [Candidatus Nanopelagicales bacterium]